MSFENQIFINCPFDNDYNVLLRPLIFTLLYSGLKPQISTTQSSAHIRIQNIMELIKNSKFSIHDISRNTALKKGDISRFNMPYELGLDIGCQRFGTKKRKEKKCLILDATSHTYDQSISDISGQDIKAHNNDPKKLIGKVREWLIVVQNYRLVSASVLWAKYNEFLADMTEVLSMRGFTHDEIKDLSGYEFIQIAQDWVDNLNP
jgi:hypothetical protein